MSAAEKLKALDEERRNAPGRTEAYEVIEPALRALPQIVAVVEAAETSLRNGARMPPSDPPLLPDELSALRAALAALDEALGEEKDENWRSGLWRQRS